MDTHYPPSHAGETDGTPASEAERVDTSGIAECIETARGRGHGNLDVPQPAAFFDQDEAWRTSGPDEDPVAAEDLSAVRIPLGSVSGFATAGEHPHYVPVAAPTHRLPEQPPTSGYLSVVQPPCICPKCHMDGKFVELYAKPPAPQEEKPFRYPGQPNVTNLLYRRAILVCPSCKGEFDD